ncbi:putative G3BP-like protein [Carex littledalei]|uniref:Putative G3BP-like protein n=1 Tax=Carex littledalei TaxID=544730 RepID=A0A833QMC9_9POAL|nr:putative G3BP-like protein [Carex littledalei]
MAAPFPGQINQFQIGSYFASNYYQMLQTRPQLVHQFYNNASTMVRLDISTMETSTAIGMLQIHSLIMSLNISTIEIKTWHCLESWSGGILVMVSGLVQMQDWPCRRRFIQNFFLAPQEKGYFVLNDMFHVLDQEQGPQFVGSLPVFMQNGFGGKIPISNPEPEESEVQSKEIVAPPQPEGETVDKYSIHEPQVESLSPEPEPVVEEAPLQEPAIPAIPEPDVSEMEPEPPQPSSAPASEPESETVAPLSTPALSQAPQPSQSSVMAAVSVEAPGPEPESVPVPAQSREVEPVILGEQPKLSYASVLRAKGQSQSVQMPYYNPAPLNKTSTLRATPVVQPPQSNTAPLLEKPFSEPLQQPISEDEGEILSVYVGNLAPSTQIADMEHVFKAFGRLKPNGIAIRSRKETGMVFAFIDFEEASGVQNAIKASPIQFKGRPIYVEGRKPNNTTSHGPRRVGGGGSGIYPSEPSRGRYSGGMGRSSNDRDYANRPGSLRRGQASRNGPAS